MKIRIVTNVDDAKGLARDYFILRQLLQEWGHEVIGCQFNQPVCGGHCDLNIFCETIESGFFDHADKNWVFPNPEWWLEHYTIYVPRLEKILCKTSHAYEVFHDKYGEKAIPVGFMSEDRRIPNYDKQPVFLHVPGGSQVKNTDAILGAWHTGQIEAPLIVIGKYWQHALDVPQVTWQSSVDRERLIELQNACLYHLMPSQYEGFGHALHESLSVGSILLTLDHPSMNELPAVRVKVKAHMPYRMGVLGLAQPEDILALVKAAIELSPEQMVKQTQMSRAYYEQECAEFKERLKGLLDG